jgi:hypothetical protein
VAAAAAVTGSPDGVALLVGVGCGVLVGWLGSWSVNGLRRINARVVASNVGRPLPPAVLERRHLAALGLDFARASALTLAGILGVLAVAPWLGDAPQDAVTVSAVVLFVAASAAVGVVVGTLVRGRRIVGAFAVGMLLSTVITLWLS